MRQRRGFTLIEILIVVGIITLLAALLFPAFSRAQEKAYQGSCTTNLQQIGMAVRLYYQDERYYPTSLSNLLPDTSRLANKVNSAGTSLTTAIGNPPIFLCDADTCPNPDGGGYLKSTDYLLCPNDDTIPELPRSSYGDLSVSLSSRDTAQPLADLGRSMWNGYGYNEKGYSLLSPAEAADPTKGGIDYASCDSSPLSVRCELRRDPDGTRNRYNPNPALPRPGDPALFIDVTKNPLRYSLSNRFAPATTVITHCPYHRVPTSDLALPTDLYDSTYQDAAKGAKEIVLRVDGSVKTLDAPLLAEPVIADSSVSIPPSDQQPTRWQKQDGR